ncbi:hypothetical protein F2Q68_00007442 [Brassica cretica]|uniref:Uncharacterized protein n=1 Tax=Brassica cretica TaxID=69181 RepID=A0A8S9L1M7_BRACR|nr:hypothetical protein F2Q68_00007442 [Brassica cretica]
MASVTGSGRLTGSPSTPGTATPRISLERRAMKHSVSEHASENLPCQEMAPLHLTWKLKMEDPKSSSLVVFGQSSVGTHGRVEVPSWTGNGKLKPSQCLSLVTAYLILPTPPPPRASPGGVLSPTRCNTIVSTRRRLVPVRAIDSDLPHPIKFSGGANVPFLMMQLPQIILNAQNLLAGNNTALSAVPSGMLTGLLGNLSLLSYSAKKREKEAAVVQTLGVISTLQWLELCLCNILLLLPPVVMVGLVLNCLFYFGKFGITVWRLWEDFITVGGLSVLPQIMWSTFVPLVPNNILPGASVFVIAVAAVIMVSFQALLLQFLFSP